MKSYIQQQLGQRIKELRKIKGFSQEQFAEKIDIATNTLSSIETGNAFMTAPTLEKIVEVLQVSPKDLFSFDDDVDNEDMYASILKNLEFIKNDKELLKLFYKFAKSMI